VYGTWAEIKQTVYPGRTLLDYVDQAALHNSVLIRHCERLPSAQEKYIRPQSCKQYPGAPGEGARRSSKLSQLAGLTETLRSRTPATRDLSAGALAFVNWKQSMRGELPCQGTYCFSLPPTFWTH